jgi:hypothetical protein
MAALLVAPEGHQWMVAIAFVLLALAMLVSDGQAARPDDRVRPPAAVVLAAALAFAIRRRARVVLP